MPIADYATYKSKILAPYQRLQDTKVGVGAGTRFLRLFSLWTKTPDAGAVPSTAEAPTRATLGAMGQQNSDGVQRLAQVACSLQFSGCIIICDRLSHQGGLDGTVTEEQETNLPTAALTRYTSGVGVFAALEIYTAVGSTATTILASYTNQDGQAKTTPLTVFGALMQCEASGFIILPLAEGDIGVRSVESVTLTDTTGTAGNFGVTLFKPLFIMPVYNLGSQQFLFDSILNMCGNMPQILNDACLFYTVVTVGSSSGIWLSANRFIEE